MGGDCTGAFFKLRMTTAQYDDTSNWRLIVCSYSFFFFFLFPRTFLIERGVIRAGVFDMLSSCGFCYIVG